jgi:hypothetical protein
VRKNGLGYILGDFFINTPGHPGLAEVLDTIESNYVHLYIQLERLNR